MATILISFPSCDASLAASDLTDELLWFQTCWCWIVQPRDLPCQRSPPTAVASILKRPKSGCSGDCTCCGNLTGGWTSRSLCLHHLRKVGYCLTLFSLLVEISCVSNGRNILCGLLVLFFVCASVFCEACQDKSGLYAKVSEMLPMRVASYMLMPYTLPVQSAYSVAQR